MFQQPSKGQFRGAATWIMQIKVKNLCGKQIEIDVEPTDTIMRVKERLEEREGIPPVQQRLIYNGRVLIDERSVEESDIKAGDVIFLVLALRGGH